MFSSTPMGTAMIGPFAAVLLVATTLSLPALAQNATPDSSNGRYTFSQVSDGVLRLDTRTGEVSVCNKREMGWTCQVVPDDRAVLENEIARLEAENTTLRQQLASRGAAPADGMPAKPGEKSPSIELKLPSDAEIEKVMTFFEKIWRRLVEMMQNVQREVEKKS
jgi:hypothetical protein